MPLIIKLDNLTQIESGTIQIPKGSLTTIVFDNINIIFSFEDTNELNSQPSVTTHAGGSDLTISLKSFDKGIGAGVIKPFVIGDVDGHKLLISFFVLPVGEEGNKQLSFALYKQNNL